MGHGGKALLWGRGKRTGVQGVMGDVGKVVGIWAALSGPQGKRFRTKRSKGFSAHIKP